MKSLMARALILSVALLGVLFFTDAAAAAGAFLAEFEDLPLAPGLTELPGGMLFDSPGGRIVDATAEGEVTAQQVLAFYMQTLPELGWEKIGPASFRRDNEVLRIEMDSGRRPLAVHFSVVPK